MLSEIGDLDQFIPRVLDMVAEVTGVMSCSFFEIDLQGTIWLRYWHHDGKSYIPAELIALDSQKYSLVRSLAEGFQVPEDYLGIPALATGTCLVDHVKGTSVPEYDRFALQTGWELELNIGVGAGGVRDVTLCLYRGREDSFTPEEVAFAESIAKYIRLAWTIVKAAESSQNAALALERESKALAKAAAIEKVNGLVRLCVDRLATTKDPREAILATLAVFAQEVAPLPAHDVALVEFTPEDDSIEVTAMFRSGQLIDLRGTALGQRFPVAQAEMIAPWKRIQTETFIWGLTSDETVLMPQVRDFHEAQGAKSVAYLPLRCAESTRGWVAFSMRSDTPPSSEVVSVLEILAQQVALALELERVGAIAQQVEEARLSELLALERGEAARARAADLERAHIAQQATIDAFQSIGELKEFAPTALRIVTSALGASQSAYFEHLEGQPIRLRHWCYGEIMAGPEYFCAAGEDVFAVYQELVAGFEVPTGHLGSDVRARTRPVVLDHEAGTSIERFDRFCCALGCDLELNVPLVANGKADGAFLIFRPNYEPFTREEIDLAASLSKQLAMGTQIARFAEQARDYELARLREESAVARLKMTEEANARIQTEIEERKKAEKAVRDYNELIVEVLNRVGTLSPEARFAKFIKDLMRKLGAHSASLYLYQATEDGKIFRALHEQDDYLIALKDARDLRFMDAWSEKYLPPLQGGEILFHGHAVILSEDSYQDYRFFYDREKIKSLLFIPMMFEGVFQGFVCFRWQDESKLTSFDEEFLRDTAHQILLAARIIAVVKVAETGTIFAERQRIARDLHDSVAQGFTGVILHLEAAASALDLGREETSRRHLSEARKAAKFGLAEARRSVYALRDEATSDNSFVDELVNWVSPHIAAAGIELRAESSGAPFGIDPNYSDVLLKIAREVATNVIKHARATHFFVDIKFSGPNLLIEFRDNGVGFDASQATKGFGLVGIRERTHSIGCHLSLSSELGVGTRLVLNCPFAESGSLERYD